MVCGQIIIVTGPREVGKTTFCRKLAYFGRALGWDVAGVISPAVYENKIKVGIEVENLRSGEHLILAINNTESVSGLRTSNWCFDHFALEWGNSVLKEATPCDLLIVDELGVLEFERIEGWLAGFDAINMKQYRYGFITIRPEMLKQAQIRWPKTQIIEITRRGNKYILWTWMVKLFLKNYLNLSLS
jgi:hypothetical protein